MYRLIATDLDGTLLNDSAHVSEKDKESIRRATEAGVKFVLATGRPYTSVQGTLEEIGLKGKKGEYVISYNGGAITDNENNELVYFQGITFEEADALFKKGLEYGLPMRVYTLDGNYHYALDDDERNYLKGRLEVTPFDEDNIDFLKDHKIIKLNYVDTDKSNLDRIREEITDLTKDLDITFSSNRYMEFNRKGVDKGEAIKRLAEILGFDVSQTIASGDNFNDASMVEAAGLGVGVSNAVDELKEVCDVVIESSCNEDPMTEIIDRFIFNEEEVEA